MADMKSKIKKLLQKNGGMTAKEIAKALGCSSSAVNRFIYYCDEFEKDDSSAPVWTIKGSLSHTTVTESDPVLLKLQNREGAKAFTQKDFDNLANWEYGEAYIGKHQYETATGNIIECDSKSEVLLLEYLEENNLVKCVGGQMLKVSYDTAFRTDRDYYPDIVALTWDNHIAVFEVKSATAMDNHTNMEKYRGLAEYCEKHGYMYVMIDPASDYQSFEELRDMEVSTPLLEMFEELNDKPHTSRKPYKHFEKSDVEKWYERFGAGWTWPEFQLQVHSLIIYYEWYNFYKNDFQVFSRPVKLDNDHKVIDYI